MLKRERENDDDVSGPPGPAQVPPQDAEPEPEPVPHQCKAVIKRCLSKLKSNGSQFAALKELCKLSREEGAVPAMMRAGVFDETLRIVDTGYNPPPETDAGYKLWKQVFEQALVLLNNFVAFGDELGEEVTQTLQERETLLFIIQLTESQHLVVRNQALWILANCGVAPVCKEYVLGLQVAEAIAKVRAANFYVVAVGWRWVGGFTSHPSHISHPTPTSHHPHSIHLPSGV
jgi:hypothetical protein